MVCFVQSHIHFFTHQNVGHSHHCTATAFVKATNELDAVKSNGQFSVINLLGLVETCVVTDHSSSIRLHLFWLLWLFLRRL